MDVANINGSTKRDIVVAINASGDDYVQVLLGNGDGTFHRSPTHQFFLGPSGNHGAASGPYGLILVDLDEDGQNDVVTTNGGTQNISVLINSTALGS